MMTLEITNRDDWEADENLKRLVERCSPDSNSTPKIQDLLRTAEIETRRRDAKWYKDKGQLGWKYETDDSIRDFLKRMIQEPDPQLNEDFENFNFGEIMEEMLMLDWEV